MRPGGVLRYLIAISVAVCLGGCGDPLADFPRLSEADIPEEETRLEIVPTEQEAEGGFFSRFVKTENGGEAAGDDVMDISLSAPGAGPRAMLPYGKVARACKLRKSAMGKKVAQYPEKRPRHILYDTSPGKSGLRTFYLTGLGGDCALQFTASMAIFGSVEMHEQLRYGLPSSVQPYSSTDKAYEKLKSRVCAVPRKKPCARKIGRLERDTVFLSVYENFGANQRWSDLLLHKGRLVAQDIKG